MRKAVEFTKANADWKMVKPIAARADFSAVDGLVGRVESAQMKKFGHEHTDARRPQEFGFDKPQAIVNVHLGSAKATLEVGGKADDTTIYVRDTSKPDIFTIDNSSADDFKKPADDYRKKELFDFRAFDATRVELTKNGQTVIFERVKAKDDKSPDTWHRVSPNPGDPDRSKVEGCWPAWRTSARRRLSIQRQRLGCNRRHSWSTRSSMTGRSRRKSRSARTDPMHLPHVPTIPAPRRSRRKN